MFLAACSVTPAAMMVPRPVADEPIPNPPVHRRPHVEDVPLSPLTPAQAEHQVIEQRIRALQAQIDQLKRQYQEKAKVSPAVDKAPTPNP